MLRRAVHALETATHVVTTSDALCDLCREPQSRAPQAAFGAVPSSGSQHCRQLLCQLSRTWPARAQVRKHDLRSEDSAQDEYLEALLPFATSARYQGLPRRTKQLLLAHGWIAYNAKTIAIETEIVSPVCNAIIAGQLDGVGDHATGMVMAQTLTDEAYHVLLCKYAINQTERRLALRALRLPPFVLQKRVHASRQGALSAQGQVLRLLAVAFVSELFVSDYLRLLASADDIHPTNRQITRAHRRDEGPHGIIFREVVTRVYRHLTQAERDVFADIVPQAVLWFGSKELSVWHAVLKHVCPESCDALMEDARATGEACLAAYNFSSVLDVCRDLGCHARVEDQLLALP